MSSVTWWMCTCSCSLIGEIEPPGLKTGERGRKPVPRGAARKRVARILTENLSHRKDSGLEASRQPSEVSRTRPGRTPVAVAWAAAVAAQVRCGLSARIQGLAHRACSRWLATILRMTYVVTESCIKCKYTDCVDVCPVDCFREGPNMLVIDPDECIDCTLCVAECPVEAIFAEDDVPVDQREFTALERRAGQGLAGHHGEEGGPRGRRRVGQGRGKAQADRALAPKPGACHREHRGHGGKTDTCVAFERCRTGAFDSRARLV